MTFILSTPNNSLTINDSRLYAIKATKEKLLKYKGKFNVNKKCNKSTNKNTTTTDHIDNVFKELLKLEQPVLKK
ncbi:MAG TPA: hypothetical protein ACHBX0_07655 [Arsenophonus sp.]